MSREAKKFGRLRKKCLSLKLYPNVKDRGEEKLTGLGRLQRVVEIVTDKKKKLKE